jgi:hypothetical protein
MTEVQGGGKSPQVRRLGNGEAAMPDKPDRAGFTKRAKLDMQRHEKEGNSKEEENIPRGELGGSHGGRGEERAGGYGDKRCCSLHCGRIACSERINLIGTRGWGWRCQAYFWACTVAMDMRGQKRKKSGAEKDNLGYLKSKKTSADDEKIEVKV